MHIPQGTRLGRYEIRSHLGAGGMGEVYLAYDTQLDRNAALKLLPAELTRDPDRLRRFDQEAKAASALNHPNIVTIYEIGEAETGRFIAMEHISGKTIRELVDSSTLTLDAISDISCQIAKALNVAHGHGIVHRDIKPENIMVRDDGYVKILDFGIARLVPGGAALSDAETLIGDPAALATEHGIVMGTVRYMSPEQARGEKVSTNSDIFSLGTMLYELVTGQHPFQSDSNIGTLHAIISQPVISPKRLNAAIPAAIDTVLLRMLQKDAAQRPTAAQVEAAFATSANASSAAEMNWAAVTINRKTVGRVRERSELRQAFDDMSRGRGSMLCLAGEPGIGKTTLVEDFLKELTSGGNHFIARGRCSERLSGSEAYLPFLEALESLLQRSPNDSLAQMMKLVAPTWFVQISPFSDDSSAGRAQRDLKTASKEWMKREIATFLLELSKQQPVVFFLDDLQWSDPSTVELVGHLADRIDSMRLLLLTTYRSSELLLNRHPFLNIKLDLQSRGKCHEINVGFLNREDIDDYLKLEFPKNEFPSEITDLIHRKTEGSPLFMVDLVQYLRDQKVIWLDERIWRLGKVVPELERELPESVRSMIQRKIDQLTDQDRMILTVASVQGYEFDSAVLATVSELEADTIEERLEELERVYGFVQLVAETELPDLTLSLRYRFVHVLYQNALYASLRPTRRAALSSAVANCLSNHYAQQDSEIASELAFLFKTGRDFDRASSYFLVAGANAARVFANQEAIIFYRAAAEMIALQRRTASSAELDHAAAEAFESLGKIYSIIGKHEKARATLASALLHVADDSVRRAHLNRLIAATWQAQRQTDRALSALDEAQAELDKYVGDHPVDWWFEFLETKLERMWVSYWRAEIHHLEEMTSNAKPLIEERGTQDQKGKFFHMQMLYHLRKDRYSPKDETVKFAEAALAVMAGSDDVGEVTAIQFGTGFVSLWQGEFEKAEEYLSKALQMARRRGDILNQVLSLTYLTVTYRKRRIDEKVAEHNTEALDLATNAQMSPYIAMARANNAWLAFREGDYERAETEAGGAFESWQKDQGTYPFQWAAIWLLISLSVQSGKIDEAVNYAKILLAPTQQIVPAELARLTSEAITEWETGNPDSSTAKLTDAIKTAEDLRYL